MRCTGPVALWPSEPLLDQMVGSSLLYRCRHLGPYHPEVVAHANRAGKIVRDVLDFACRRKPNREPVSLDQLVDRSLGLFKGRLQRAGIEVARAFNGRHRCCSRTATR